MSEYEQVINIFLALGGIAIVLFLIQILIGLACLIFTLVAQAKVHQKANKPGWTAIIPYYAQYVRAEIGGNVTYFWPFFIASLVGGACSIAEYSENEMVVLIGSLLSTVAAVVALVYHIKMDRNLAIAFGQNNGFTVGLILLPVVFYPILAWGKTEYIGPQTAYPGPKPPVL